MTSKKVITVSEETIAKNMGPKIRIIPAKSFQIPVTGYISPYPTVDMVTIDHHNALGILSKVWFTPHST